MNWSGDATGNANPLNIVMTTNKFIIANFAQRPTIFSQPQSVPFGVGDTVSFTVAAGGVPPLAYQWQFNGSPIPAATNTLLTLTNVQASQAGAYSVVVTNRYGVAISDTAMLTIGSNLVVACDERALREAISRPGRVRFACDGTVT